MRITARTKKVLWIVLPAVLLIGISVVITFMFPRKVHTVTFMCNNLVVDEIKVKHLSPATPPTNLDVPEGKVFSGWSSPLDSITEDLLVRANLISATDANLFTMDSVYVRSGGEARVPLRLQGQVNLAGFELTIVYPFEELEFKGFVNLDKDMFANCIPETGEIKIAFASGNNVSGSIDICELIFEAKGKTGASEIVVSNILASQLQGDEILKTTAGSISATVYYY